METDTRCVDKDMRALSVTYLELCNFVLSQPELFEVNECLQVLDCLQRSIDASCQGVGRRGDSM